MHTRQGVGAPNLQQLWRAVFHVPRDSDYGRPAQANMQQERPPER